MTALDQAEAALLQAIEAVRAARLPAPQNDVLEVPEAVALSGRTPSTIRRWAKRHRLGRRLGGVWILSRQRFTIFIEGSER